MLQTENTSISVIVRRRLAAILIVYFILAIAVLWSVLTGIEQSKANRQLQLTITDTVQDITDASDENLLRITRSISKDMNLNYYGLGHYRIEEYDGFTGDEAMLHYLADLYEVDELMVVDSEGVITQCLDGEYVGFDLAENERSAEFLCLLDGSWTYVQPYGTFTTDGTVSRKMAGVRLSGGGFVLAGYGAERLQSDLAAQVDGITENRHIEETGYVIIADENLNIVSSDRKRSGKTFEELEFSFDPTATAENKLFRASIEGESYDCIYTIGEGYYIIAVIPVLEILSSRNVTLLAVSILSAILFLALYVVIYGLIRRRVINGVCHVNDTLDLISAGNLDAQVEERSSLEFSRLSDEINHTVRTLKGYIDAEAERLDSELKNAKNIQVAALPTVFPPYPEHKEFDIYARMDPAKEVGGDFYDIFLVGRQRLAFLVADVSGKGIPAALFMMRAKAAIKSYARSGLSVEEIFTKANQALSEENEAGMFVTAWMGILNFETGDLEFVNAGHNPPLLRRTGGQYEYLHEKANFVLAGFDSTRYIRQTLHLEEGDELFLYTDGVTEENNEIGEFYGEERLQSALNRCTAVSAKERCRFVWDDIWSFVKEAPQFDDITMLSIRLSERP